MMKRFRQITRRLIKSEKGITLMETAIALAMVSAMYSIYGQGF